MQMLAHPISCFLSVYYGHDAASVALKEEMMYFPQLLAPVRTCTGPTASWGAAPLRCRRFRPKLDADIQKMFSLVG